MKSIALVIFLCLFLIPVQGKTATIYYDKTLYESAVSTYDTHILGYGDLKNTSDSSYTYNGNTFYSHSVTFENVWMTGYSQIQNTFSGLESFIPTNPIKNDYLSFISIGDGHPTFFNGFALNFFSFSSDGSNTLPETQSISIGLFDTSSQSWSLQKLSLPQFEDSFLGIVTDSNTTIAAMLYFNDTSNYFRLAQTGYTIEFDYNSSTPTATPEPGTMLLMGVGAAGAAWMRRRKAKLS